MSVAHTSRTAYHEDADRLTGKRKIVYACIRDWPIPGERPSIEDIANETGERVATVCGRMGELQEAGMVVQHGTKRSPTTGKTVKTYVTATPRPPRLDRPSEQAELFGDDEATPYF